MYYYIRGRFIKNGDNFSVVEASGIGYRIYTSASAMHCMPSPGEDVLFYTHFHVREDAQDLYGFPTQSELSMFLNLISVSGVGPKAALSILSSATPEEVALAVVQKNAAIITRAQGVGPKLAERVILELKNKIKNEDLLPEGLSPAPTADTGNEVISALVALGYSEQEAKRAVGGLSENLNVEDAVKQALKNLMR